MTTNFGSHPSFFMLVGYDDYCILQYLLCQQLCGGFVLVLSGIQLEVVALFGDQLVMRALLHDPALSDIRSDLSVGKILKNKRRQGCRYSHPVQHGTDYKYYC